MVRPGCGQGRAKLFPHAAAPGAAADAIPVPAPAAPAASLPPPVKPGLAGPGPPSPPPESLPPLRPRLLLRQLSIPTSRPAASPLFPPPPAIRPPLHSFLLAVLPAALSLRSLPSHTLLPRPWSPQTLPHLRSRQSTAFLISSSSLSPPAYAPPAFSALRFPLQPSSSSPPSFALSCIKVLCPHVIPSLLFFPIVPLLCPQPLSPEAPVPGCSRAQAQ